MSPGGKRCKKCTSGKRPDKKRSSCEPCPPRHYFSTDKLVCLACAAGKAPSEDPRVEGCVCAVGFYNSTRLSLRCIDDPFKGAAACTARLMHTCGRGGTGTGGQHCDVLQIRIF